jgi:hypothetical protein
MSFLETIASSLIVNQSLLYFLTGGHDKRPILEYGLVERLSRNLQLSCELTP